MPKRSMTLGLTVAFVVVGLTGAALTAIFARYGTERAFDQLTISQFLEEASNYYRLNGSWADAQERLAERSRRFGPGSGPATARTDGEGAQSRRYSPPRRFALADGEGRVVAAAGAYQLGDVVPARDLRRGFAVEVDGQRVGTALIAVETRQLRPLEQLYFNRVLWSSIYAALGASAVAVVLGMLLARRLTRTLRALTRAANAVARGDLQQQVVSPSQDELGMLADAFNRMSAQRFRFEQELQAAMKTAEASARAADEARDAAERANHAKSAFLANMSHELRTPLNAILGYAQLMAREEGVTPRQAQVLRTIQRSGEHLLSLINDVLEITRIESGRVEIQREVFDLPGLLAELEEMFALRAEQKGLSLRFERAENAPKAVRADPRRIRQALMNLLSNAVKFTRAGGVRLRVRAEGEASGSTPPASGRVWLVFEVEDTGVGISPEELQKAFDAFTQTESGRQTHQGTGLGLTISRQFARLMGGDITADSEVGKGSIFRLRVPVEIAQPSQTPTPPATRRALGLAPGQTAPDGGRWRLLVADDKDTNRALMVDLLRPMGFEVEEARTGQEAVDLCERRPPHLVWMDMRMPVMDGYEATRRIKARAKNGEPVPVVIALTASALAEQQQDILEAGCDDLVHKPVDVEALFQKLTRHLGIRFVYEEPPAGDAGAGGAAAEDAAGDAPLRRLPADARARLTQAATALNGAATLDAIARTPELDRAWAERLAGWARGYRFDRILAALSESEPGRP